MGSPCIKQDRVCIGVICARLELRILEALRSTLPHDPISEIILSEYPIEQSLEIVACGRISSAGHGCRRASSSGPGIVRHARVRRGVEVAVPIEGRVGRDEVHALGVHPAQKGQVVAVKERAAAEVGRRYA